MACLTNNGILDLKKYSSVRMAGRCGAAHGENMVKDGGQH